MTKPFDVFLSHASADAEWVKVLAENLVRLGIRPFLDRWEIAPGDVLVHELDRGLRSSKNGVLVVSPEALGRPWVQQEYAAMVKAAVEHGRRLVPVLYRDAEMPPLLANLIWIDYSLRCLALNLELQSPDTPLTLRTLTRLRELLGEDRFRQLAGEHLDADSVAQVVDLLDRFAAEGSDG